MQHAVVTHRDDCAAQRMRSVLLIGLLSGALYVVVYLAQRGLYRNGLLLSYAGVSVRGDTADRARLLGQCAAYYGATIALFLLYARLLARCLRGCLSDRRTRALALALPVLFNLGLLLGRPYLSMDVYTYIAYGHVGAALGGNPYVQPVIAVADTPVGAQLIASGWRPFHVVSTPPYGPLWVHLETAVLRLTEDVATATLLFKGIAVAASLGVAALIWAILGRVRPDDQLLGTLIYLWNPLIVVEFAAEGHNDTLMILCVLAALLLAVRARPAVALAALMLGVFAKYAPLILLPAQVIYCWFVWRGRGGRARLIALLLLGLLVALGAAALLYAPLWAGAATFGGLRVQGEPRGAASTAGALYLALAHSPLRALARPLTSGLLGGVFGATVLVASWWVRDAAGLLRACAGIALVYVLVAIPVYWPWYAALPLALLALTPDSAFRAMVLALSVGARLVAPLEVMDNRGLLLSGASLAGTDVVAVALPLVALLLIAVRAWHRRDAGALAARV